LSHELLRDSRLFAVLLEIDREFLNEAHTRRCAECGGRLDRSDYPRKARGGPPKELAAEYFRRFSLCCDTEGCRTRATPPSMRFLGRRVYWGAVVVLATAMLHGVTEVRTTQLRRDIHPSLSESTLMRWREWWREKLCATEFWRDARARFAPPLDESRLPASILDRFEGDEGDRLVAALRFLAPVSTQSRLAGAE